MLLLPQFASHRRFNMSTLLWQHVTAVMRRRRRPISWTSSMARWFHAPAVLITTGKKDVGLVGVCQFSVFVINQTEASHTVAVANKKAQMTQGLRATAPSFQPPSGILSNRK